MKKPCAECWLRINAALPPTKDINVIRDLSDPEDCPYHGETGQARIDQQ